MLPLLSPAPDIPVCDVSHQDAFYCSSVRADHNLADLGDHDSFWVTLIPRSLKLFTCFHLSSTDVHGGGCVFASIFHWKSKQLFGFADVEIALSDCWFTVHMNSRWWWQCCPHSYSRVSLMSRCAVSTWVGRVNRRGCDVKAEGVWLPIWAVPFQGVLAHIIYIQDLPQLYCLPSKFLAGHVSKHANIRSTSTFHPVRLNRKQQIERSFHKGCVCDFILMIIVFPWGLQHCTFLEATVPRDRNASSTVDIFSNALICASKHVKTLLQAQKPEHPWHTASVYPPLTALRVPDAHVSGSLSSSFDGRSLYSPLHVRLSAIWRAGAKKRAHLRLRF